MTQKPLKNPLKKQFLRGKNEAKAIFSKYFFIDFHFITTNMRKNDTKQFANSKKCCTFASKLHK